MTHDPAAPDPAPEAFSVALADYARDLDALRAVRETVFVQEQRVPLELEWDELDPRCVHVLARDAAGRPVGTGRLTPERRIGRMAVLREWRGRGVGDALLLALLQAARDRGWHAVSLHAQAPALDFYLRHGFRPRGPRFLEAGIEHQDMVLDLDAPHAVQDRQQAVATVAALAGAARRRLWIYSRDLDPGLFDADEVVEALRRFGTAGRGGQARILLQDAAAAQRGRAPLIALAQRLPSVFAFREVEDPVDRAYPSAFVVNDTGGWYFRNLGHRFDGEADLHGPGRARQLHEGFDRVWERSRPVSEYRALGI
jgi:predicted GNAT family N-acyltransferase